MRWWLFPLALTAGFGSTVLAEDASDPLGWLNRMAAAAQTLSYTGTFVYQNGSLTETSRITHVVDAAGAREKLEVLDGSPREVVRMNDEVKCYIPGERVVIVERHGQRRSFPARLPESLTGLAEFYSIRKGEISRVAGLDSQVLILEPKDGFRYGHMMWADVNTGLLLKARMVNERNESIEQFVFTQLQIGGNIDRENLKAKLAAKSGDWRVHNAKAVAANVDDGGWLFKAQVPGFKRSAGMRRQIQGTTSEVMHFVFSDGLAAVSVFIEPIREAAPKPVEGMFSTGAINVYKRVVGDHLLVVLGEVPPQTLKLLGDGVEPRRK